MQTRSKQLIFFFPSFTTRDCNPHRLCQEILADLPVTYELGEEATEWVQRMMTYTVAGGKMNRGLATLSVRNTFAKLVGHNLTNKVCTSVEIS